MRTLVLTASMAAPPSSATIETKDRERLRRIGRKVRTRLQANSSVRRIEVENAELWAVALALSRSRRQGPFASASAISRRVLATP